MTKTYFNNAIIGNSGMLGCLTDRGELVRLFWPHIDYPQHIHKMLSGFFIAAYRIAHPEVVEARIYMANFAPASANNWISFASYFLSQFLRDIKINANFLWYLHVVPSLIFLIYIPHSKLLHIFTSSITVISDRQKELRKDRDSEPGSQ